MNITFSIAKAQCCAICNPVSLADFETDCVEVDTGLDKVYICIDCLTSITMAFRDGAAIRQVHPEVMRAMGHAVVIARARACQHEGALSWPEVQWCPACGAINADEAQDIPKGQWVNPGQERTDVNDGSTN